MNFLSVGQAADRLGVKPRDLSNLFYQREVPEAVAPRVGHCRVVLEDKLPELARILRRLGRDVAAVDHV